MPAPSLTIPRSEAKQKINALIGKGYWIREETALNNDTDLAEAKTELRMWRDYAKELLSRSFDDNSIADSFSSTTRRYRIAGVRLPFQQEISEFKSGVTSSINNLESLLNRLDLIPEPKAEKPAEQLVIHDGAIVPANNVVQSNKTKKVFIVHGHDEVAKITAARLVEQLGLEAVIFHEQVDNGQTIIEKLERVSEVDYAVILFTPDDEGYVKSSPDDKRFRARQNVVLEWGYFMAKLGRQHVSTLVKGNIELPSDIQGILYTTMDDGEAWKLKVARELRAAGFEIDMNRLF